MNSSDISELLKKYLHQIEKILKASIKSKIPMSKRISQHIVLKAGKRFRPILLLLSYLVFKEKPSTRVYNAAAAVEILHNASLLHDDIVDNSSMRRGQKTSNLIWGDHASVLAGDFLLSKALWVINKTKNHFVMDSVTNAASELANGQIMDLTMSRNFDEFSIDNYFKMGRIWFLGTTDLHEMPLKVFRHAKICLAFLVKNYEEVENFVPYDHWENIAWLVKLGFKVEKTPYYLDDHHFYRVFYCNFQKTDTKIDKSRPIMH